jgi:hypothetical protein
MSLRHFGLLLGLGLLLSTTACDTDPCKDVVCGDHGQCSEGACTCEKGYKPDEGGLCNLRKLETEFGDNACTDGEDNDGDQRTDCADAACAATSTCSCEVENGGCHEFADCTAGTDGAAVTCACQAGYGGNGRQCVACANYPVYPGECPGCGSSASSWGGAVSAARTACQNAGCEGECTDSPGASVDCELPEELGGYRCFSYCVPFGCSRD